MVVFTLGFFALTELGLRYLAPEMQFLDPKYDAFWKAQLRQQLAQSGKGDYQLSDIVHDKNFGWRMKPLYQSEGISHNSKGFRGSRDFKIKNDKPRILALGDSFTYGLGVNDEQTYAHHLEIITGVEVVNAGVTAHGVDQSLLMWEKEGRVFQPETVIFGYAVDKFFTNTLSIRNLPKPYFTYNKNTQSFALQGYPVPDLATAQSDGILNDDGSLKISHAGAWLKSKIQSKLGVPNHDDLQYRAKLSEFLLKRLNDAVTQNGARLIVTFIGHCYDGEVENTWIENSIMESCKANGIECINMADAMRSGDFDSYYGGNCHWSEKGHQFAAKRISEALNP